MNPFPLVFLKLGGSLITDKTRPRTPRPQVIAQLAAEIAAARAQNPQLRILLGHGSGSFAHVPAKRHRTRQGVDSPAGWRGFAEVWYEAAALNRLVMDALHDADLPALAFPPSAGVIADAGRVLRWEIGGIRRALENGLLPVVYGDVVFDRARGGTILSTEEVFAHLTRELRPQRILLAGIDPGVWADYPACTRLLPEITPQTWEAAAPALGGSAGTDVTGGMRGKVRGMLDLTAEHPGLEILIFGGEPPGNVSAALLGERIGTRIIDSGQQAAGSG